MLSARSGMRIVALIVSAAFSISGCSAQRGTSQAIPLTHVAVATSKHRAAISKDGFGRHVLRVRGTKTSLSLDRGFALQSSIKDPRPDQVALFKAELAEIRAGHRKNGKHSERKASHTRRTATGTRESLDPTGFSGGLNGSNSCDLSNPNVGSVSGCGFLVSNPGSPNDVIGEVGLAAYLDPIADPAVMDGSADPYVGDQSGPTCQ